MIEETLKGVLDSTKGSKVFTRVVRKKKKKVSQAIDTKARDFMLRKINSIGVNKKRRIDDSSSNNLGLPVSDRCSLSPMKVKANSHLDKNVHKFFKKQVEFLPEVQTHPNRWAIRHAIICPVKLITSIITICFVTEDLHKHWYWFYKRNNKGEWEEDMYHIKFVNFSDGFAYQNGIEPAVIDALQLMNLHAFVHHPAFNFLQ